MLKTDKAMYLVETKEDYDRLMIELEKLDCNWYMTLEKPTSKNHWKHFGNSTVIYLENRNLVYGHKLHTTKPWYKNYSFIQYKHTGECINLEKTV